MKIRNKIKKVLFVFAILFTSYVVFLAFDIYLYGFEDEKTNADVAIILGAGISGEEPSPVFQERINHCYIFDGWSTFAIFYEPEDLHLFNG